MDDAGKMKLWKAYADKPTPELREKIILEYAPLVKVVAEAVCERILAPAYPVVEGLRKKGDRGCRCEAGGVSIADIVAGIGRAVVDEDDLIAGYAAAFAEHVHPLYAVG